MLKVGDEKIIWKSKALASSKAEPCRIVKIIRLTATRAYWGSAEGCWFPIGQSTDSEQAIRVARDRLAKIAIENRQRAESAEKLRSDPRYMLEQRLESVTWAGKLTMEQLQTVVGWLDSAK